MAKNDVLKELLGFLEERLVKHDENRKEVQAILQEVCSRIREDTGLLNERISEEISRGFDKRERKIFGLIEKLNESEGGNLDPLIEEAKEELSREWEYKIQPVERKGSFACTYELKISSSRVEKDFSFDDTESVVNQLQEHIGKIQESVAAAQDRLAGICAGRMKEASDLEGRVNGELETAFKQEDARIQCVVNEVNKNINNENPEEVKELVRRAKLTLLKNQEYSLNKEGSLEDFGLKVEKRMLLKWVDFEKRKAADLVPSFKKNRDLSLSFPFFDEDELNVLEEAPMVFGVEVEIWERGHAEDTLCRFKMKRNLKKCFSVGIRYAFTAYTTYLMRIRLTHQGLATQWSDKENFTPGFEGCCIWVGSPFRVEPENSYSLELGNPGIATKINDDYGLNHWCIIIGNTYLPPNKVTSWSVKILKSRGNNGESIFIGVAPFDINKYVDNNYFKCGWYFNCYCSTLCSGPPHNYRSREYGPREGNGEYVHTGDSVGVVMDTAKGELSFVLNGMNLGVAFEGIPLDKPLVPCALLRNEGDSIKIDTSEAEENVDSSISVPSNITTKSITWDSITLTWDAADDASFYQIEVDESKLWDVSTTNSFTKRGLLAETEHNFRVRAVRRTSVSKWSDAVKGRTQKAPDFNECVWKECPNNLKYYVKYFVDERNPRIATKIAYNKYYGCTIVGTIPISSDKVASWSIKILKSQFNGGGILIGVALPSIDQNDGNNREKCGWYFDCYGSRLRSGPPHKYPGKKYGPRKGDGEYVHTGDSVGVVMDTEKGELSFVVNGVNLGVAYEGIPLDKPLVPCILLGNKGDSVELVI